MTKVTNNNTLEFSLINTDIDFELPLGDLYIKVYSYNGIHKDENNQVGIPIKLATIVPSKLNNYFLKSFKKF